MSAIAKIKPVKTEGKLESHLRSKRRHLKEELDRIYYTLPYDEVQPIVAELKDTIDCLTEMGETHQRFAGDQSRILRRKAVAE